MHNLLYDVVCSHWVNSLFHWSSCASLTKSQEPWKPEFQQCWRVKHRFPQTGCWLQSRLSSHGHHHPVINWRAWCLGGWSSGNALIITKRMTFITYLILFFKTADSALRAVKLYLDNIDLPGTCECAKFMFPFFLVIFWRLWLGNWPLLIQFLDKNAARQQRRTRIIAKHNVSDLTTVVKFSKV